MSRRIVNPGKQVWTAHLPSRTASAAGRLSHRVVYLLTVLDRDGRFIRTELYSDHARKLAADLISAADRADLRAVS